jgi:hypothetical protein
LFSREPGDAVPTAEHVPMPTSLVVRSFQGEDPIG